MSPFRTSCGALAIALLGASPSFAWLQSRPTQGFANQQAVQIQNLSVRATIQQAWADVEEDVELSPTTASSWETPPTTNANSWEIFGDFALPRGAVLTGALLWDGDHILKAKLKSKAQAASEYEAIVARNTAPIPQPRDPLVVEKTGDSTYALKLFPVTWSGMRRMRLRYLVPLKANGSAWEIPLGSAFANNAASHPEKYEFQWTRGQGSTAMLSHDGILQPPSTIPLLVDFPQTQWFGWNTVYHSTMAARLALKGPLALTTQFDSSTWKGGYILFEGNLPDSILKRTGLRQEFMVLWRWNRSEPLAQDFGWGPTLTTTGYNVVEGASGLRQSLSTLVQASSLVKVGMVTDEGKAQTKSFPLSGWGSDTFAQLQDYLGGLTYEEVLRRASVGATAGVPSTNSTKNRDAGAKAFVTDLKKVFSLYSQDSGVVRHLVVVTAGPAEDIGLSNTQLPAWPEGLTVSTWGGGWYGSQGHWEGIDLRALESEHGLLPERTIANWLPFPTPKTTLTWSLEFEAGTKVFNRTEVSGIQMGDRKSISAAFHASEPWKQKADWKLYDMDGNLRLTQSANDLHWIHLPSDTAVAMLWGGSPSHWSETWRNREVGSIFGFVDRNHSLLALPSDTLDASATSRYKYEGVPYLLGTEIFAASPGSESTSVDDGDNRPPVASLVSRNGLDALSVTATANHVLKISLPANLGANAEIVIRDLRGKVIMRWSATQLTASGSLEWRIPTSIGKTMLTVELRNGTERVTRSVMAM